MSGLIKYLLYAKMPVLLTLNYLIPAHARFGYLTKMPNVILYYNIKK